MYRIDAGEKLQLISIFSIPYMKKGDASSIISGYQRQSRDIIDVLGNDDDYSSLDRLKTAFKKK